MSVQIKDVDIRFYNERLKSFLPEKIIDFHTHVWLKEFCNKGGKPRGKSWPLLVADQNPIEDLKSTYELMFPQKQVTPLIFGWPERDVNLDATNDYVSKASEAQSLPGLMVSTPDWDSAELQERVSKGKFLGLKPYLSWAPENIPFDEITVYDFLPKAQLEMANQNGWIVLLHIPRSKRLKDPVNLKNLIEIEENYPDLKLVVAHIGRAYCLEDVGNAMEILRETRNMVFDFSGNTNAAVMQMALETFGPQRVVFGSDLPIVRMRMRRICENGNYVNLVPPGVYGDLLGDSHMREVSQAEGEQLSFFLYESIGALLQAAAKIGLSPQDIEDVFYGNAKRILDSVEWNI
jgi:uncharacterized protein